MNFKLICYSLLLISFQSEAKTLVSPSINVTNLVKMADRNQRGKSFQAEAEMIVDKNGSKRSLKMRIWALSDSKSMVKILSPERDRGTGNLRLQYDLWQYLPKIGRIIRIPSSMMLQSWMGSDFSNDDLVKGGSWVRDYTHAYLGQETVGGVASHKVELKPKPNAPIVWGKLILWIAIKNAAPIQQEFYSEKGELIKRLTGKNIGEFNGHAIPTEFIMQTMKTKDSSTIIRYNPKTILFDKKIEANFFNQENLRRTNLKNPTE